MSQIKLSGRINPVMAHTGGIPVGCDGRKRIISDHTELEELLTKAGRSSFREMLNTYLILKAFLGSLVLWSEDSYFFFSFFPKIQDNLNVRSL